MRRTRGRAFPLVYAWPRRAVHEMKSSGAAARSSSSARSRGLGADAKPGSASRLRSRAMAAWCSGRE